MFWKLQGPVRSFKNFYMLYFSSLENLYAKRLYVEVLLDSVDTAHFFCALDPVLRKLGPDSTSLKHTSVTILLTETYGR